MRILADNPGPTFTRSIDSKFVSTVKEVLRNCRDPSVQQILRETLMTMYREKAYDTNLTNLFAMWQKESGIVGTNPGPVPPNVNVLPGPMPTYNGTASSAPYQSGGGGGGRHHRSLPPPAELSQRIEEARTSGKLLQQLVQSTPQAELRGNELIREFADRCQSAQRSIQGYISADDPMPDDETMQTLIETSEQLSLSLSKHSRALLQARRAAGGGPSPSQTPPLAPQQQQFPPPPAAQGIKTTATYTPSGLGLSPELNSYSPPPIPQTSIARKDVPSNAAVAPIEPAYTYSPPPLPPPNHRHALDVPEDPFSDEHEAQEDQHNRPITPPSTLGARPPVPNVTASYVKRQDDAEEHLTMHGASAPVSPERSTAEVRGSLVSEVSPLEDQRRGR
jgi:GAT domain